MSPVLSRRLDPFFRPGAVDGVALVRVLNEDIGSEALNEDAARRHAVTAMTGAMIRYLTRRRLSAAARMRFMEAYRLWMLKADIYEWIIEFHCSDADPDADMLRVRLLQIQIERSVQGLPDARDLAEASNALVRVSLAGTNPTS